jgi:hypothetical protein
MENMTIFELSRVPQGDALVFINGKAVRAKIRNGKVILKKAPEFEPINRPSARWWRLLGKIINSKKIYNKGCRSIVSVFYVLPNSGAPQIDSFRLGARPLHKKSFADDGDGHTDEVYFEYD